MKQIALITAALLGVSLLFTNCNKIEETQSSEEETVTITATIDEDTKTSMDGLSVNWSEGDRMAVVTNEDHTLTQYTIQSGMGGKTATFSGAPKTHTTDHYFKAFYPYERVSIYNSTFEWVLVTIPTNQTYVENGFQTNLLPMRFTGYYFPNNTNIVYSDYRTFQYLGGVFQFNYFVDDEAPTTTVSGIRVSVKGGIDNRNGDVDKRYSRLVDNFISAPGLGGKTGDAYNSLYLTCPNVPLGTSANPTQFNIVYSGGITASNGITVTVYTNRGNKTFTRSGTLVFEDGKRITFPATEISFE